jgi:hypothetical protein
MGVHKGNIQNNANEHETSKNEREMKRNMQNLYSTLKSLWILLAMRDRFVVCHV